MKIMLDIDEINDAVHGITMMVAILLDAQNSMQAPDAESDFQVSRADGEMIAFASFDIHKRVTALREWLNGQVDRQAATIVPIGGNERA